MRPRENELILSWCDENGSTSYLMQPSIVDFSVTVTNVG